MIYTLLNNVWQLLFFFLVTNKHTIKKDWDSNTNAHIFTIINYVVIYWITSFALVSILPKKNLLASTIMLTQQQQTKTKKQKSTIFFNYHVVNTCIQLKNKMFKITIICPFNQTSVHNKTKNEWNNKLNTYC